MVVRPAPRDADGRTLTDYPRPSVAVDTAVLTVPPGADNLHVLLVARRTPGRRVVWALPGTFLHEGETLAQAVLRSLAVKADMNGLAPRQLQVFDALDRDDRGWVLSVAHVDIAPWTLTERATTARNDIRVVPVGSPVKMPYDHPEIVRLAVADTRARYLARPDPDRLLGQTFTLLQLRLLHEAVAGRRLPKDSFRRHMRSQLRATGHTQTGVVGKPAELFAHPGEGRIVHGRRTEPSNDT